MGRIPYSTSLCSISALPISRRVQVQTVRSTSMPRLWRRRMASVPKIYEKQHEFFRYTSGRWLWNEEERLRERYRFFDVAELKKVAIGITGSKQCLSMAKIGEGNFNKVFKLVMDDQSVVIARIPHPNAGPAFYTTASEAAVMDFARSILHLPVPKVLSFNSDVRNPVGTEYILMEEAPGTQLSATWNGMDLEEQVKITEDLVNVDSKFLSASFTLSGGLYHKESLPDAAPAALLGDFPDTLKDEVRHRFVIGPSVERLFWEKDRERMTLDRGPWRTAAEYLAAIARCEISWIREFAKPKTGGMVKPSEAQNSPSVHIDLLEKFLQIIPSILPQQNDLLRPVLWHRDLHKGNIFVRDGKISSIIDWQATWIGPMLLWARTPLLVDFKGDIMLRLPENFKQLPKKEQPIIEDQVRKSILVYLYETDTKKRNPALHTVLQYPHGMTISELVEFAGITWDGDILPFRESLLRVERDWHKIIGSSSSCPYHFSVDEIRQHRLDGDGFNETQDFWDALEGKVARSGYVSHEDFDTAIQYFAQLRRMGLDTLEGVERDDFERQTRWVEKHVVNTAHT